jgi:cobalt/nickel transport system permease protein
MTLLLDIPAAPSSPIHRLDPRWKLAGLLPAVCAITLIRQPGPALAALVLSMVLVLIARLPLRWYAIRLSAALALPAFFVLWLPFVHQPGDSLREVAGVVLSDTGVLRGLTLLMKAASIVSVILVLLGTAPVHDSLKAAQSLRMPGWLVHLVLMSYRYVGLLGEEFMRLRTALRVRGYRNRACLHSYRTVGQVAGTLLVRGHERSERVAQAMRCRGFDGRFRSLLAFQTRGVDVLFCAAAIALASGVLVWDVWQRG